MRPTLRLSSPGLVGGPQDHVVDGSRVHAGALEERADDVRGHVVGPDLAQGTAVAAERRAQPVDDHGRAGWIVLAHQASMLAPG